MRSRISGAFLLDDPRPVMTVRTLQHCAAHIFVQIGWRHCLQIAAINCILFLCKRLLLLRSEIVFLLTQDNVKALHTADTAQPVIDRRIKRKIKFLCQRSPPQNGICRYGKSTPSNQKYMQ